MAAKLRPLWPKMLRSVRYGQRSVRYAVSTARSEKMAMSLFTSVVTPLFWRSLWVGCRSGGPPTPHNEMQGRRQADGAMISRALRGKCPLLYYSQGNQRRDPEKPTRQSRHPSCAPVLPLSCALCLRPCYHHSEAEPRETGKRGSGPGPSPHSARARRPNHIACLVLS